MARGPVSGSGAPREPDLLTGLVDLLTVLPTDPAARAFDDLPADADEKLRRELADHLFSREPPVLALLPGILDATGADTTDSARRTIDRALDDLYNTAQVDVLRRARRMRLARPVWVHTSAGRRPDPLTSLPIDDRRLSSGFSRMAPSPRDTARAPRQR
ncbi:MAG: hypothetical protein ACFCVF_00300 [Kineosporiaceae bacterium]